MNSIKLLKFIVELICILTLAKGNLITLDGQCPFGDLKPAPVVAAALLDAATFLTRQTRLVFHSVAETSPSDGNNRTDISSILEHTQLPNNQLGGVKFIKHFRSKETEQCNQYEIIFKPTILPGVYDLSYQVAPDTNFADYKGYFLSINPQTLTAVGFICHDLPNSQYQFEIAVLSGSTIEYHRGIQEEVKQILAFNNLGHLMQYLSAIERKTNCL